MIEILSDWVQVGKAICFCQEQGLPLHETPQKNWDHCLLVKCLKGVSPNSTIVDLGCGSGHSLHFLHALGYKNVKGIDFRISLRAQVNRLGVMYAQKKFTLPYRMTRGDITRTNISTGSVAVAYSISTIEHGVDVESFLRELSRVLRPGGVALITTDYWPDKIVSKGDARPFGLPWQVFSRADIQKLIAQAESAGLKLINPTDIGDISTPVVPTVSWSGAKYTFIGIGLVKQG